MQNRKKEWPEEVKKIPSQAQQKPNENREMRFQMSGMEKEVTLQSSDNKI